MHLGIHSLKKYLTAIYRAHGVRNRMEMSRLINGHARTILSWD